VALWIDDGRGQWLLERRPPVGIWGGLWSLPQFDSRAEAEGWAAALGRLGEATALAPVEHVFTHFRLTIEPLRLRLLEASARLADNAALDWIDPARLGDYGLPAPIRRLLQAERGAQAGLFGAMPDTATSL
jgi:A/G-specific adenine glycosylase